MTPRFTAVFVDVTDLVDEGGQTTDLRLADALRELTARWKFVFLVRVKSAGSRLSDREWLEPLVVYLERNGVERVLTAAIAQGREVESFYDIQRRYELDLRRCGIFDESLQKLAGIDEVGIRRMGSIYRFF